jgi:hypothetical protein
MANFENWRRCRQASVVIFLGLTFLSWAPATVHGQLSQQNETAIVGADDLALNWESYESYQVDIVGHLECLTDRFCDFYFLTNRPKVVLVDTRNLNDSQKRRLVPACNFSCETTIRGYVDLVTVLASDVGKTTSSNVPHQIRSAVSGPGDRRD